MNEARLRPLAEDDLVERTRYYKSEGGDELAERFFDTAIESLRLIERMPGGGSLRIGELCEAGNGAVTGRVTVSIRGSSLQAV